MRKWWRLRDQPDAMAACGGSSTRIPAPGTPAAASVHPDLIPTRHRVKPLPTAFAA